MFSRHTYGLARQQIAVVNSLAAGVSSYLPLDGEGGGFRPTVYSSGGKMLKAVDD